jgi:hypothetical protein
MPGKLGHYPLAGLHRSVPARHRRRPGRGLDWDADVPRSEDRATIRLDPERGEPMRFVILILLLALGLGPRTNAVAQMELVSGPPYFDDFRVSEIYRGTARMPDFSGRDRAYANFRTRIREGIKEGVNFCGRYAIISFGCGTGCRFTLMADITNGRVYDFPLGGEDYQMLDLDYRNNSCLIRTKWNQESMCGPEVQEGFVWRNNQFESLGKRSTNPRGAC